MTEFIAAVLLILRILGGFYLVKILRIQIGLLRKPINEEVWDFRRKLHYIILALFTGNLIPIILDALVVLQGVGIGSNIRTEPVLVVYAASNALIALLFAILLYKIYSMANQPIVEQLEEEHVKGLGKKHGKH